MAANTGSKSNPLHDALEGLLEKNGGLQGISDKFSHAGLGDIFSSWVGLGENHSITAEQIQSALGVEQIQAIAGKIGIDPAKASGLLAEFLPRIIDRLTPAGQLVSDPAALKEGIASLIPSLLPEVFKSFIGGKPA